MQGRPPDAARRQRRGSASVRIHMKRYIVQTFGCQMNVHDSRRIEEVLHDAGYAPTEEVGLADLVVVNTCSVREKAEHKLMSLLGTFRPLKEERPGVTLAVAGCVAQQEGERLLEKAPHLDLVLGPDNIPELPSLLRDLEGGAPPLARTAFDMDDPRFLVARPRAERSEVTSFVTTMKGCDERCTFCIVPYTRGPERYRRADEIVGEIAHLVEGGVREITLLGQTVNSWYEPERVLEDKPKGRPIDSGSQFAGLLRRIARDVPDLVRLRYTSPHPRHLTDALIAAHAELSVLPSHLHLPVQSGADRVLRRMSRSYTRKHYVDRARALRDARPGLTMSTDLIVGFPGETEEDFEETLSLVAEVGFVAAFCFKYSPRPYTPALKLGDDVPEEVKDERLARLFALVERQQTAHLATLVGTTQEVLVEGPSRGEGGRFTGRSGRHEIVHLEVPPNVDPTGHLVQAAIDQAYKHSLHGAMVSPPLPTMTPRRRGRTSLPVIEGALRSRGATDSEGAPV
jgi:tRNA-2-methylthio-N6-dimethylallyladenosine synthase